MSDQPSTLLREARGFHTSIKELLKTKEPFDKEIDFQRKNLRRRHLSLLLVHPYSKESENAETHLWMQTSYILIADYKHRLGQFDRQAQEHQSNNQTRNGHGPVEHRKLLTRFRQFLADEEKFWGQFVVRYYRTFALDEAHQVLVSLGILSETTDPVEENAPKHGRNHFQFPNSSTTFPPTSSADRETRLAIMSKAVVCLGDIARYREQYRFAPEEGGRKRNKRGGGPIHDIPRPRNFEKARSCYEQAKFLTPHDGNPSHQLAILAGYEKDNFTALVHYYRSLCVNHPYETASDNMTALFSKALRNTGGTDFPSDLAHVPKVMIEEFKKKVVYLHALWKVGDRSQGSLAVKEAKNVYTKFYDLISERHLPEDFIIQLITLAQGALWKAGNVQDSSLSSGSKSRPRSESSSAPTAALPSSVVEARIYTHLLSLYRALLEVGIEKLKEPPPLDSEKDLAQRLIVEFRRTLPAMRIAGKWLRANFRYVMSDPEATGVANGKGKSNRTPGTISTSSVETIEFWDTYAEFLRALSRAFPADRLPDLTFGLGEDIEMRGFEPLKGFMGPARVLDESDEDVPRKETEVHPNELQLMRIKDVIHDAKELVKMENSPLAIYGNQFVLRGVESQVQPIPSNALQSPLSRRLLSDRVEREDDAMTEATSNTDDAVIREAFKHLDQLEDDDDDDDEIVWDPKPSSPPDPSPVLASVALNPNLNTPNLVAPTIASITPSAALPVPIAPPLASLAQKPTQSPPAVSSSNQAGSSAVDKTTAEDLLKGFMTPTRADLPRASRTASDSLVPRSPFIFDQPGNLAGNSIWSASQDERSLRFSTNGPQTIHNLPPQHNFSASQDLSSQQSIWSYSSTQNSQHHLAGALPSAPFPNYAYASDSNHQRIPSASLDTHLSSNLPGGLSLGQTSLPTTPGSISHLVNSLDQVSLLPGSYAPVQQPAFDATPGGSLYETPDQSFRSHARHLSLYDPPVRPVIPSMSSIWGNNG